MERREYWGGIGALAATALPVGTASGRGTPKKNAPNPGGGQFGAQGKTLQRVNFRAFL